MTTASARASRTPAVTSQRIRLRAPPVSSCASVLAWSVCERSRAMSSSIAVFMVFSDCVQRVY
jgi:hypothetical protein